MMRRNERQEGDTGGIGRLLAAEKHFGRVIKGSLSILAQEHNSP